MIGVMPEPAANATRCVFLFCATFSAATFSASLSEVTWERDVNAPCGFITSIFSPTSRTSLAHVENLPPMSFFTATRISPRFGTAQIE